MRWVKKSAAGAMAIVPGKDRRTGKFIITNAEELIAFAKDWNAGRESERAKWLDSNGAVYLGADITLQEGWTPIGTFSATFDGGGHTVKGLSVPQSYGGDDFGFFRSIGTGEVAE